MCETEARAWVSEVGLADRTAGQGRTGSEHVDASGLVLKDAVEDVLEHLLRHNARHVHKGP